MKNEGKIDIIRPFGPAIGSTNIPKTLIDKINNFIDEVIKDKNKSKKFDWGKYLAGQVTQEIKLPKEIIDGELLNFLNKITKAFVEVFTDKKVTKFQLISCWVVRQFQNEYNPIHWHNGHISGAGFLKLPNNFGASKQEKATNANGRINFTHGTRQFLSMGTITKKPEIGKIYLFPNYLMHSVYPFYGEGERRSMSFNAYINDDVYDIYSQ
tara:strand:+ start:165 stop:797 length:633 start_codon:yes stop_codon:yes gene_type:complete